VIFESIAVPMAFSFSIFFSLLSVVSFFSASSCGISS